MKKGYKGFNKGLVCRGKQYKENMVFEEDEAVICEKGMHFCTNPFEVLNYYPLVNSKGEFNDFAEVEALDECYTDDGKKYCTRKLKIGAKLSFGNFINACVDFILGKTSDDGCSSGNGARIGSSGNGAQIGSSGDYARIKSEGENSVVCCAGHDCIASAKKGSWITLAEWNYSCEKDRYVPVFVKTEYVDGERIKADTFYKLENGEFVEVE